MCPYCVTWVPIFSNQKVWHTSSKRQWPRQTQRCQYKYAILFWILFDSDIILISCSPTFAFGSVKNLNILLLSYSTCKHCKTNTCQLRQRGGFVQLKRCLIPWLHQKNMHTACAVFWFDTRRLSPNRQDEFNDTMETLQLCQRHICEVY